MPVCIPGACRSRGPLWPSQGKGSGQTRLAQLPKPVHTYPLQFLQMRPMGGTFRTKLRCQSPVWHSYPVSPSQSRFEPSPAPCT